MVCIVSRHRRGLCQLFASSDLFYDLDVGCLRLCLNLLVVDHRVPFPHHVVLDQVVCDAEGQHRVLDWVQLVDMDNSEQDQLASKRNFDLQSPFLKI